MSSIWFCSEPRESEQFLKFQADAMIKVWEVRRLWVKAKNQKLEVLLPINRARPPSVRY